MDPTVLITTSGGPGMDGRSATQSGGFGENGFPGLSATDIDIKLSTNEKIVTVVTGAGIKYQLPIDGHSSKIILRAHGGDGGKAGHGMHGRDGRDGSKGASATQYSDARMGDNGEYGQNGGSRRNRGKRRKWGANHRQSG